MSQYARQQDGYDQYHAPQQHNLYPAYHEQYANSQDSLAGLSNSGAPISGSAGVGGYGATEKLARNRDNPYAQNYKPSGGKGKWVVVGLIALCLIGAGVGIAIWRVQASKSSSTSKSSSSSSGTVPTSNSGTTLQVSFPTLAGRARRGARHLAFIQRFPSTSPAPLGSLKVTPRTRLTLRRTRNYTRSSGGCERSFDFF